MYNVHCRELVGAGVLEHIGRYLTWAPETRDILAEVAWILTYLATRSTHQTYCTTVTLLSFMHYINKF